MKKLILILVMGLIVSSCKEDESKCSFFEVEQWLEDRCERRKFNYEIKEMRLCDDDIKELGATHIYYESGCVKYYRKINKKL